MVGVNFEWPPSADEVLGRIHALPGDLRQRVVPSIVRKVLGQANITAMHLLSGARTAPVGDYPVPVRTGHLSQSEQMMFPGQQSTPFAGAPNMPPSASPSEGYLLNVAVYASVIHKDRPFQSDAVDEHESELMAQSTLDEYFTPALISGGV